MPFDEENRDPHGECRHEIHRLTDEANRLREENAKMRRTFGSHPLFAEKDAEIERLRAALKPFAGTARDMDERPVNDAKDDELVWVRVTWAQFKAARVTSELNRIEPIVSEGWKRVRALENELKRVTDHLETWAADHPEERTTETDAAIFCARQLLTK